MKKLIAGAFFVLILLALRRFGPGIGKRAMAKCQEMMASHREDAAAGPPDPEGTASGVATPALT